jgi:hypothetical protein
MAEFLKDYGIWIFGVLMLGMHVAPMIVKRARGMGCGMGGHEHDSRQSADSSNNKERQAADKEHTAGCH